MISSPFCNCMNFQFTTSQGGRRLPEFPHQLLFPFNSRPHKEVDYSRQSPQEADSSFNSRPHKEVDGKCTPKMYIFRAFQFTTSQGGRPAVHP